MDNFPFIIATTMQKPNQTLSARLKDELKKRKVSVPQFETETGIPKDRVYKWLKRETDNITHEDGVIVERWLNGQVSTNRADLSGSINAGAQAVEGHPSFQVILQLAESNSRLSEGNKELIESNRQALDNIKIIAEANLKLANNNEELVQITKNSIERAQSGILPVAEPNWGKVLAALAKVAAGERYGSEQEAAAALHKIVFGGEVPKISAHTQTNSDKKHSGKGS